MEPKPKLDSPARTVNRGRSVPRLLIAVTGIALAVAVGVLFWQSGPSVGSSKPSPGRTDASRPEPGADRNVAANKGLVRVLLKPSDDLPDEQGRLLMEVQNQGPLKGADFKNFLASLMARSKDCEQRLANSSAGTKDSGSLLKQAEMVLDVATAKAAVRAMEAGTYVTTRPGDKTPPLSLPEAEVARAAATLDGQTVNVTIVMPLKDHPELEQARHDYDATQQFDSSERARQFNALPEDQRLSLAKQISTIMRNPNASQEERQFVNNQIGWGNRLSEGQGIVIVPAR